MCGGKRYVKKANVWWCRGRIIDEDPGKNTYSVFFVDYGNVVEGVNELE